MNCSDKPEQVYRRLEKKEMMSGVRYDSLFKGLYLGMPYTDFREHCMQMHIRREFREGGLKSGAWLEYKLKEEMKYPAAINFFPEFENQVISKMHAAIYYDSHVSFSEKPFAKDSLLHDVLNLMKTWYGDGFIKIDSPDSLRDDIHVKVNGNRRITVYTDDSDYLINIWFVDLLAKEEEDERL